MTLLLAPTLAAYALSMTLRRGRFGLLNAALLVAAAVLLLAVLPASLGVAGYMAPIVVVTVGYALFQTANNASVMKDVPADRRGVVGGMLSLSRNLGLVTGASLMGALFAIASGTSDVALAAPEAVALGMRRTFVAASVLLLVALAVTSRSAPAASTRRASAG